MSRPRFALISILVDAGIRPAAAKHLQVQLDRLRLGGLGSDDLADALLKWSYNRHREWLGAATNLFPNTEVRDVNGQLALFHVDA